MALVPGLGITGLTLINDRCRPLLALLIVLANGVLSAIPSFQALAGDALTGVISIPHFAGELSLRIDSLSAWFILIINFTSITGVIYGGGYLKAYSHLRVNRQLHWIFYAIFHASMLWVCMFENGVGFLIAWELMSLSSLILVIFEFQSKTTLKAGINYMIQMHLSVALLTFGFIWLYVSTGSFNFDALKQLPLDNS